MSIKMIKAREDSKIIDSFGYDAHVQTLRVKFKKTGTEYDYFDVPDIHFKNLREAESQGSYISQNIAKVYRYEKVS
jgi:hypothetical protein